MGEIRRGAHLATLERELAEREFEWATLQNELRAFEARYLRAVGALYVELDELKAQVAEGVTKRKLPIPHRNTRGRANADV